jgi:Smg protein
MFDVLVYLYETYWRPDACPDHRQLARKLTAVGFENDEIQEALSWLDGLASTAQHETTPQSAMTRSASSASWSPPASCRRPCARS